MTLQGHQWSWEPGTSYLLGLTPETPMNLPVIFQTAGSLVSVVHMSIALLSNLWSCETLMAGSERATMLSEAVLQEEIEALMGEMADSWLSFIAFQIIWPLHESNDEQQRIIQ